MLSQREDVTAHLRLDSFGTHGGSIPSEIGNLENLGQYCAGNLDNENWNRISI